LQGDHGVGDLELGDAARGADQSSLTVMRPVLLQSWLNGSGWAMVSASAGGLRNGRPVSKTDRITTPVVTRLSFMKEDDITVYSFVI
jgi:hypothetical protein